MVAHRCQEKNIKMKNKDKKIRRTKKTNVQKTKIKNVYWTNIVQMTTLILMFKFSVPITK